jgi:hypothetical protein
MTEKDTCVGEVKNKNYNGKSNLLQSKGTVDEISEERFEEEDEQTLAWSVALYGCESWKMKKEVVDKNALEM